jgi:hypothetical protein
MEFFKVRPRKAKQLVERFEECLQSSEGVCVFEQKGIYLIKNYQHLPKILPCASLSNLVEYLAGSVGDTLRHGLKLFRFLDQVNRSLEGLGGCVGLLEVSERKLIGRVHYHHLEALHDVLAGQRKAQGCLPCASLQLMTHLLEDLAVRKKL